MKFLENVKGSRLGLYDNRSKDNKSVTADKVIDVTDFCPESKQCIIKYARVTRGMIAQINDLNEDGIEVGLTLHYHINEMTPITLANDEVFQTHCMGANPRELAQIIFDHQPNP